MSIAKSLLNWYKKNGRHNLPWRQEISAYRVWLSEIMLQQTQVATVLVYFEKFIKQFPTIESLANASSNEVLFLWAGLGYYSRARNLHHCAKIICEKYQGIFPNTIEELILLPGIGQSTAAAICSIVFKQNTPILDGNVKRVLARLYAVMDDTKSSQTIKELWQLAEKTMQTKNPNDYTQAIMDLGATICKRQKPLCEQCPLKSYCVAYKNNLTELLPKRNVKKRIPEKSIAVLILQLSAQEILLEQRPVAGIWGGLWSLPECPLEEDFEEWIFAHYDINVKLIGELPKFRHTFTHYHLHIHPYLLKIIKPKKNLLQKSKHLIAHDLQTTIQVGTPTPIRKILNQLS